MSGFSSNIPPPPPPKTAEYGWVTTERESAVEQDSPENDSFENVETRDSQTEQDIKLTSPKGECVLCVKGPSIPLEGQRDDFPTTSPYRMEFFQIQVYPRMSAVILSRCVSQAASCGRRDMLAGLFGEQDRIFHFFEHILSLPDPSWQSYSVLKPPSPRIEPEHDSSSLVQWLYLGISVAVFAVVLTYSGGPRFLDTAFAAMSGATLGGLISVHEWIFNLPFRELYRNGPHIIGWEGLPLAEVCNRITHFGGRDFWIRNINECEEIYSGKEEAFLRTMRPMAYGVLAILSFYIVRHLVAVYGESKRSRTNRAVIEAFQAFQTLVRIASRQNGGGNEMNRPRR